jgi:hypothetical protein
LGIVLMNALPPDKRHVAFVLVVGLTVLYAWQTRTLRGQVRKLAASENCSARRRVPVVE